MMRQINLLPIDVQQQGRWSVLRNSFVSTFAPVVGGMILLHVLVVVWGGALEKTVQDPQAYQEAASIRSLRQEISRVKSMAQDLWTQDREVSRTFVASLSAQRVLVDIGNVALAKVWLSELNIDLPRQTCELSGGSYTTRLVSEFMLTLKQLPYFKSVDLVSMGKEAKGSAEKVNFKIRCGLR